MRSHGMIASLLVLAAAGCTWVKPTPEGEKVRVLDPDEVVACRQLGKTTVTGKASVAGIERGHKKVSDEFSALARNSAAKMGGDTVVPLTEVEGDTQVFAVYKCINP
jgi:hypothetical protein